MTTYIAYIHAPGVMTPHMRVLPAATEDELLAAIRATIREWPRFDLVEVYDEQDRPLVRLGRGDNPIA